MRLTYTQSTFFAFIAVFCLLFSPDLKAEAPGASIIGTVKTSDGQSAAYVNIFIKEIQKGTSSNQDGAYSLKNLKEGVYTVTATFVGLQNQQQVVSLKAGETLTLNFTMSENARQLRELVITAHKTANEVPVSAGKVSINPMDLPQSISIIGQNTIQQQQSLRLSDVIKNVNGVYLGTTRGSTQENFYARGYGFSSSNMFKNGSRINTGSMPEMSSLERVEVLKGSAAILYGNVAPGGILNMVTKQPKFEHGGEVSMRVGSYDFYKPAVDIYGPISSNLAYRINGSMENAKSFRQNVSSERYYINPSLLFKLGAKTDLLVQGDYLYHHFTPDFGTGAINNVIANISRSTFLGANWSTATTQQTTASATLNHQFNPNWQLNVIGSYQDYNRDYYSTERIQPDNSGDWTRPLNKSKVAEDYYSGQVNLTGKFKTGSINHTLLSGIDADRYFTATYTFNQPANYDKINILDPNKYTPRTDIPAADPIKLVNSPSNRFGIYVQDLISLSDKFKVLAGLRWSYQESLPAITNDLVKNTESKAAGRKDNAFSPRLGLVYKPLQSTSFFASYANSFTVNTGTDVYGNILKPSLIDQYEVGVKNDFLKGFLSTNFTVYRIVNNNLAQTARYLADGVTVNNNSNFKEFTGQTISDGAELDITAHPIPGLDILAGYSHNFMRYTKTPGTPGSYVTGERLTNTPSNTANASAFYTFQSSKLQGIKIGASANYIGKRIAGWNNTIGQTQAERQVPVTGFTTVDLSLGYTYKRFTLLGKISNLSNTLNYYVHENYSVNPIAPRQFATTLSYKF